MKEQKDKWRYGRTWKRERRHDLRDMKRRREHTLVLELPGASRLILELLAQLVQQLCKTGVGSGNHPTMCVVHFCASKFDISRFEKIKIGVRYSPVARMAVTATCRDRAMLTIEGRGGLG